MHQHPYTSIGIWLSPPLPIMLSEMDAKLLFVYVNKHYCHFRLCWTWNEITITLKIMCVVERFCNLNLPTQHSKHILLGNHIKYFSTFKPHWWIHGTKKKILHVCTAFIQNHCPTWRTQEFPFHLSRNYNDHQQHMKVLFPYMSRMLFEVEGVLSKLKTGICSKNSSIASCPVTQCHKHLSIMIIISTTQLKRRAIWSKGLGFRV